MDRTTPPIGDRFNPNNHGFTYDPSQNEWDGGIGIVLYKSVYGDWVISDINRPGEIRKIFEGSEEEIISFFREQKLSELLD